MLRVDPAGAQDQVFAADGLDRLLAGQLAGAIDAQRVRRVVLVVGFGLAAVEHVVGGVMDQRHAEARGFFGEHLRAAGIDREGLLAVGFRRVDGGIGRRVDDQVRPQQAHLLANLLRYGEVQRIVPEGEQLAGTRQLRLQLAGQLARAAGDQDFHGNSSASRSSLPAWSLADSCGASSNGHWMRSSGSFHSRLRSCSGA